MKREAIKKWIWEHMHESIAETIKALNVKLTGHYRYYGIYGNYIGLQKYYKYVRQELWKSKRRRDQTCWLTWRKYMNILKIHPLENPRIYLKHVRFCEGLLRLEPLIAKKFEMKGSEKSRQSLLDTPDEKNQYFACRRAAAVRMSACAHSAGQCKGHICAG